MPNSQRFQFRDIMRALDQALTCPTCGKSRWRKATAWRGRGTGQRGASHYAATAIEPFDPARHCTCSANPNDCPVEAVERSNASTVSPPAPLTSPPTGQEVEQRVLNEQMRTAGLDPENADDRAWFFSPFNVDTD